MSWWCVAWSEELKDKPLAVRVGKEELVLFRDASGAARATEDRCAHRRVPLSMGWVTAKGTIQCGYHGWAYDGGTGQCVEIPNFRPDEPISPRVKVRVFAVAEAGGAIFVDVGTEAEASLAVPALRGVGGATEAVGGQAEVGMSHPVWVENLIADPIAALGLTDLRAEGVSTQTASGQGSVVVEQGVRSSTAGTALQPLVARLEVWALTGFAQLVLRDAAGSEQMNVVISSMPLDDERTLVRWRLLSGETGGIFTSAVRKLLGRPASERISIRGNVSPVSAETQAIIVWRDLLSDEQHPAHQIHVSEER